MSTDEFFRIVGMLGVGFFILVGIYCIIQVIRGIADIISTFYNR